MEGRLWNGNRFEGVLNAWQVKRCKTVISETIFFSYMDLKKDKFIPSEVKDIRNKIYINSYPLLSKINKNWTCSLYSLIFILWFLYPVSLRFKYALRIHNAYHTHLISINSITFNFFQFSSVAQSCPTLCKPLDCSMPCFPVHHQLPELAQIHIHRVRNAIQPSHPIIPFFSCLWSFPASLSFPMSQFFASSGQSIRVSASASVLPMNIRDWFPLGWTGWISLQSKGLSRVFSNTTVQKHQFFSAQLCL